MSTPPRAPRPTPTMIDMGVASPSAHGQAMMSTDTAAIRPNVKRGSGPQIDQARKATAATAITSGTNQPETRSARRWIGARLRWASATICTMRASMVSRPTLSARMTKLPDWFMVAPITLAPASLVTAKDSPVTIDSSTELPPSITSPSTGTLSPGRTRRRSPTATASRLTSSSLPSARDAAGALGREIEERADGAAGLLARLQFEHLAQQHQHRDDGGGLEIDGHGAVHGAEGGRETGWGAAWRRRCRPRPRRCPWQSA